MTALELPASGGARVVTSAYELVVEPGGSFAWFGPPGAADRARSWLRLCLLAALDTVEARDETVAVDPPRPAGTETGSRPDAGAEAGNCPDGPEETSTLVVGRHSTRWETAGLRIECSERRVEITAFVEGAGRLGELRLLGGRFAAPGRCGELFTGSRCSVLFSPNPEDPTRLLRSAREPAVIGVSGDALPGRGHWFFTPAPLFFALGGVGAEDGGGDGGHALAAARREVAAAGSAWARRRGPALSASSAGEHPGGSWLGIGLAAPVGELGFGELAYLPADTGFALRLDYEGHTEVSGRFEAPSIVLEPGLGDPYAGIASQRELLTHRALAPSGPVVPAPWWSAPMFCGWGAQCRLAALRHVSPHEACTQADYDTFLAELAAAGLVPPTVVVDDGWQARYGLAGPHTGRWPDLAGWISRRHQAGQRVLLWWKAWDTEGLPEELCIRDAAGRPVAPDPRMKATRRLLAEVVSSMLSPRSLDADGLKIDFTARTPLGASLVPAGRPWGIALLHELLAAVHAAAKAAKPDALVVTHAPHPCFAGVADMIRLNDMLRLDDPVPAAPLVEQMTHRAAVVRAACPELLVDTDDWCAPDLVKWREYLAVKGELGVPALYYTTHLDRTGEALEERDYEALRALWSGGGSQ